MKLKHLLISLSAIILSFFITTVNADTAPNSFTINGSDLTMLYGSDYLGHGSTLNFTYKKTTTGKIVYCTEIHDTMTSTSEVYTLSKEMDAKFAYVLANGYPNKSITGNNYKDYYITGLALWYLIKPNDSVFTYFNLSAGTYKGYSSEVVKEVAKLVYASQNYSYETPSIKINNVTNSFTLSSDKKYYVSNAMSVSTTGNIKTYNLNLTSAPSGTITTDVNGNAKTSFSTGESFIVKVPVSGIKDLSTSFSVSASGTSYIYTAYVYNPQISSHQSLMTGYTKEVPVKASANLKISINTKAEILKIDAATNKALAGATLELTGPNGFKQTWVTETTAKVFTNLAFGKYTLKETKAPNGYKKSNEVYTYEIKADNTVVNAVFKNYKAGKFTISKIDATNQEELPGATLVLTGPDNFKETWVSTNEPKVFTNLKAGKYTLKETIAPNGYILSEETVTFTVDKDGNVANPVVMKNYPAGSTSISKIDATTGKELPGATLELTGPNNFKETWVSTNEPHIVKNLQPGKYTLKETIAPDGYRLTEETVTFTVNKYGKVDKPAVMKNYPLGAVLISKQDITTKEELYGAYLEVYKEDNTLVESWVSGKEPHLIEGLEPGKYYLKETQAPDGYILSEEVIEFEIDENGKLVDKEMVIMYNELEPDVPVPITSSFKTITTTLIGIITIALGAVIIGFTYKKNEEK